MAPLQVATGLQVARGEVAGPERWEGMRPWLRLFMSNPVRRARGGQGGAGPFAFEGLQSVARRLA